MEFSAINTMAGGNSMLCYEKKQGTLTVCLTGELDHSSADRVRRELDELILDPKIKRLVFDMKDLCFMDSSGIGLMIGRYKQMNRRGGSVAVMSADARVDKIFEMAGLYQIIERMA